jgi:hypothetical protein
MDKMVQHLPVKYEALDSNPSTVPPRKVTVYKKPKVNLERSHMTGGTFYRQ